MGVLPSERAPTIPVAADDNASYLYGLTLVFVSAIAFSLGGVFMRSIDTQVWNILFWRGAFSATLLFLVLLVREGRGVLAAYRAIGRPGLIMAGCSAAAMTCFLTSISLTTVANNSIIYATAPFVTAALAFLVSGERPGRVTLAAALIALSGVVLTVAGSTGGGDIRGDILAVGMTLFGSVGPVIVRKYRAIPMLPASSLSAFLVALVALILSNVLGKPATPFSVGWPDMGMLLLFSLCQQSLGHLTYTMGARYIPSAHTALIYTLEAVLGPFWVWLAFSESPGEAAIAGGLVVITAVIGHVLITTGLLKRWRG
jgi:drug/metabolite transporter (DMT)-like permease